ncbi:MAG: 2-succinyl-5-enolpyruvyl-6-hydroxy-3-cyclohexene-1-carboxylic-acid synthase, partial [Planctomycetota bacterium]|nr:2-succinyl-5-enolpyruvyl-6-hydroxy-3-cyclohexene-1-carboxylic-acid synthase [Planctomycetota bacterium]
MRADAPNLQALWADLIVEELVRNGVDRFVICPGSRSTPLVQAVVRHGATQATLWNDERGAAFHALGTARVTGSCAVVTTSGTAVANLLPAVVEASLDGVGLILLTADRPPELREVGANQSIRQMGIFADHVRWAFDLPAPSVDLPARALLTIVDEAVFHALEAHPGPVQINCPFREPLAPSRAPFDRAWLAPVADWLGGEATLTTILAGETIDLHSIEPLAEMILEAKHGIVVCGTATRDADRDDALALAARLGWPLYADIRSGLRLGEGCDERHAHLDLLLGRTGMAAPDVVLQFGARLTSKRMQAWLASGVAGIYALIDPEPSRLDPGHQVTHRFVSDVGYFCAELVDHLQETEAQPAAWNLRAADDAIEAAIERATEQGDEPSEPWVARWLSRHMEPEHGLFVSNSMPIRDVQRFSVLDGPPLMVDANRGASGIDGVLSTAAGFSHAWMDPCTLLIGDLALLHDLNALMHIAAMDLPLTVVVLNNGGGGIFSFLPIAEHEDILRPWVETPHDIRFEGICSTFGIPYARVGSRTAFAETYRRASAHRGHIRNRSEPRAPRPDRHGHRAGAAQRMTGPPLLLLHGFLGTGADWDATRAALGPRREFRTPTLPGHGPAPTPVPAAPAFDALVSALLAAAPSEPFDVLGYSMGGRLALAMLCAAPERIRRAVVIGASPGLDDERA